MKRNRRLSDFSYFRGEANDTSGARNPRARLSDGDVADIRRRCLEQGEPQAEVARLYRVHRTTVNDIVLGQRRVEQ